MYVYIYIYGYMHTHIYIYEYTHIYIYINKRVCVYIYIYIYIYIEGAPHEGRRGGRGPVAGGRRQGRRDLRITIRNGSIEHSC